MKAWDPPPKTLSQAKMDFCGGASYVLQPQVFRLYSAPLKNTILWAAFLVTCGQKVVQESQLGVGHTRCQSEQAIWVPNGPGTQLTNTAHRPRERVHLGNTHRGQCPLTLSCKNVPVLLAQWLVVPRHATLNDNTAFASTYEVPGSTHVLAPTHGRCA